MDKKLLLITILSLTIIISSVYSYDESEIISQKSLKNVKKASLMEKKFDNTKLLKQQLDSTKSSSYDSTNNNQSLIDTSVTQSSTPAPSTSLHKDLLFSTMNEDDFDEDKALQEFEEELKRPDKINSTTTDNNTAGQKQNFSYFEMEFIQDPKRAMSRWIDLKSFNDNNFKHEVLSNSHRRAAAISLPFNFTFYGQNLTKITVATGGFLYMGEYVHAWLAATQYIAPLMANFDTRYSNDSQILYGFNSTVFVVQWQNVRLQGLSNTDQSPKEFTFQCSIYSNGDILFVYKKIPIPIDQINEEEHPVKVGVSDAYFFNRQQIFVRRKTIYEYHKIDLKKNNITDNTAIYLKALPTCSQFKDCHSCLMGNSSFQCSWCDTVRRCSDGYDRLRQEWVTHQCDRKSINEVDKCTAIVPPPIIVPSTQSSSTSTEPNQTSSVQPSPTIFHNGNATIDHGTSSSASSSSQDNIDLHSDKKNLTNLEYNTQQQQQQQEQRVGILSNKNRSASTASTAHSSLAISLFFIISLILGISLWILYAYRNPTSTSGLFMIRWRPSTWRWNSDTRYTAASIHM